MDAIAAQERAGMLSEGMTEGRIRVGSAPNEDGSAIDDQIAGSYQPTTQRSEHTKASLKNNFRSSQQGW